MAKFRKKPVVIEARQVPNEVGAMRELAQWCGADLIPALDVHLLIPTLEGDMRANVHDWIIQGVDGEFYPCKDEIFQKTYEAVE